MGVPKYSILRFGLPISALNPDETSDYGRPLYCHPCLVLAWLKRAHLNFGLLSEFAATTRCSLFEIDLHLLMTTCVVDRSVGHRGLTESGPSPLSTTQVCFKQARIAQISASQIRPTQVRLAKVRPFEVCRGQVGAGEVCLSGISFTQVRPDQITHGQVHALQVRSSQFGFG